MSTPEREQPGGPPPEQGGDVPAWLVPEAFAHELAEYGWDTLAEHLLDLCGLLVKPEDPTGTLAENELRSMPATDVEWEVPMLLAENAAAPDEVERYRRAMTVYRQRVRAIVAYWREAGRL